MNNRLSGVGSRFQAKYKTVTGKKFLGQVLQPPDTSRVSNFLSARRYLRVPPNTPVVFGDVAIIGQKKYIVADHAEGYYVDHIYTHFKLFEVDDTEQYTPVTRVQNLVTGVMEQQAAGLPVTVYLSTQPKSSISDSMHVPTFTRMAVSNVEVPVDSVLGDYKVTRVDKQLGVFTLEMKKR